MSYQVLARKWRPQIFADVVGQQHVLTALANGLSLGRIHHAYLFSGTRGVGKTTIARLFAKGLNCETGITASPCGKCASCSDIEKGRFVDLIEIDAASRTKVEDTRELLDNVQYAPARGRFKVYLIDEVHMLSRHSFNALLKTLEEPPEHVKFLLATTDPQKLPVTILSRCLQFHLKTLDIEQLYNQLEKILKIEGIAFETRALQLLARSADGSLRDALSLTDQAIAMGNGEVSSESVSQMLGVLDNSYPLTILEALIAADAQNVMESVMLAAGRGADWDNLLTEILALLHRMAMLQLLPSLSGNQFDDNEQRLRELARILPPTDIQLYYQILLVGRKELSYAPDKRMGVEMTLLRALAFHPKVVTAEPSSERIENSMLAEQVAAKPLDGPATMPAQTKQDIPESAVPDAAAQLLKARTQLLRQQQGDPSAKKPESPQPTRAVSALERIACVSKNANVQIDTPKIEAQAKKSESYRWRAQNNSPVAQKEKTQTTAKAARNLLEHEKNPGLLLKLIDEAIKCDQWAAEVAQLSIPKLVQQMALNCYKEELGPNKICLHLRSAWRHLNTQSAQKALAEALNAFYDKAIELTIVEDDNTTVRTPLEWRQAIYEEKLAHARQSIVTDNNVQTLCQVFDAKLDEESIRPI